MGGDHVACIIAIVGADASVVVSQHDGGLHACGHSHGLVAIGGQIETLGKVDGLPFVQADEVFSIRKGILQGVGRFAGFLTGIHFLLGLCHRKWSEQNVLPRRGHRPCRDGGKRGVRSSRRRGCRLPFGCQRFLPLSGGHGDSRCPGKGEEFRSAQIRSCRYRSGCRGLSSRQRHRACWWRRREASQECHCCTPVASYT